MKEHYSKSTVAVQAWCKKCNRSTMHRVDSGRKGPCIDCMERVAKEPRLFHPEPPPREEQLELFKCKSAS